MPTIMGIRVEDILLELVTPETKALGAFFEVDSVNLILGKNGSGKTQLLMMIANAISAPGHAGSQVYVQSRGTKVSTLKSIDNDFCAIYYSGLPYKRKLSRRSGIIDASPTSAKANNEHHRMQQLGDVAKALQLKTQLLATLGYSKSIYRTIFVPALQHSKKIISPPLQVLIENLNHIESASARRSDLVKSLDEKRENLLKDITFFLEEYMDVHFPCGDRIYYLSAVEYLHEPTSMQAFSQALAFLNYVGLIKSNDFSQELEPIQELVEQSQEALRNYGSKLTQHKYSISLVINGIDQFETIREYNTPIKIEWSQLSSGLQALVEQFALIGEAIEKSSQQERRSILLMIDEGDAYLHLDWQRKYLTLLNKYLGALKRKFGLSSLQVLLASHSPLIAADMPGLFVKNLDSDTTMKTFGAPIEEIISGSFESSSLGLFAAKKINEIYERSNRHKLTNADLKVIEQIGDDAIKAALIRGGKK